MDPIAATKMEHEYEEIYDVLSKLCVYCSSDELTLPILQEKMKKLDQFPLNHVKAHYSDWPFFHNVCLSKMVTLEMVECILDKFPDMAGIVETTIIDITNAFPLHLACHNQYCPPSIISLLIGKHPDALENFAQVGLLFMIGDHEDFAEGLPLHYYVARKTNMDIDTVKMLLEAYPQAMAAGGISPLHAVLSSPNENINDLLSIIKYLIEVEPSLIRQVDEYERTPLLVASCNTNITLEVVQLVYNAWPESIRIPERNGYLPIHELCYNHMLSDVASIDILRFMLNIDPGLVRARDGSDQYLPLYHAVCNLKPFGFCKILIDANREALIEASGGMLPIHHACFEGTGTDHIDTIQYMLDIYPESMGVYDFKGYAPMHRAAQGKRVDIVELLLKYDPQAASKASRHQNNSTSYNLPLHLTCAYNYYDNNVKVAAALFDAYPQAIFAHNDEGKTPLDLIWEKEIRCQKHPNDSALVNFLLTQQEYARLAHEIKAKTTVDKNDWLSLCCALKEKAPLGSIKLLVEALRLIGHTDALPLDTACEFSSVKVVRYLLEVDNIMDEDLASMHLVQSACRGGNLEVIKYFLDEHISLVSSAEMNEKGEQPIHLLCEAGKDKVDSDSTEYIEIIWRMLLANPEALVAGA